MGQTIGRTGTKYSGHTLDKNIQGYRTINRVFRTEIDGLCGSLTKYIH